MASDESPRREDEKDLSGDAGDGPSDPIAIATTDPMIESIVDHPSDWRTHPDTTVSIETTQVTGPSPLCASGVQTVDDRRADSRAQQQDMSARSRKPGNQPDRTHGQDRGRDADGRGDDRSHPEGRPAPQQPSMMYNLPVLAGVALLCGVIGAMGYSYFSGSKSGDSSSDQSNGKNDSSSRKASSSKKQSEGGESQESNAQASSSIPGFTSAEDADTLKKQIMDLMQRVDRLGERVDRMTRPKDETPPVLRTMQIKMGELAREMDEVASLPAKIREFDTRLETLRQELKTPRTRIESARGDSTDGRTIPALPLVSAVSTPGSPGGGSVANNPTMELGIGLLERGQYASAREIFLRLRLAQPNDARVWYLSALAEGLTSGDWDGEAKRLAEKGLERERAGTPSTAQIDASLATGTPVKGQTWLTSLRRRPLGPE